MKHPNSYSELLYAIIFCQLMYTNGEHN